MRTSDSRATSFLMQSSYETDIIQVTFCAKSSTLYKYRRHEFRIIDRLPTINFDKKLRKLDVIRIQTLWISGYRSFTDDATINFGKTRRLRDGSDNRGCGERYIISCVLYLQWYTTRGKICVPTDRIVRSVVIACTNNTPSTHPSSLARKLIPISSECD